MGCHSVCQKQRKENLVPTRPSRGYFTLSIFLADSMDTIQLILTSSERRGAKSKEERRDGEREGELPALQSRVPKAGFAVALPRP